MTHGRAKLILNGEHAVLGSARAIVFPWTEGAVARASKRMAGAASFELEGLPPGAQVREESIRALWAMTDVLVARGFDGAAFMDVRARLKVPAGVGFGASAALGVAVARALAPGLSDDVLREAAMAWEMCAHGSASGVDVAAAMSDAPLSFRRGELPERLNVRPGRSVLVPVLVEAAPSTREMVSRVQAWAAAAPRAWQSFCDNADERSNRMAAALEAGQPDLVGRAMNEAHEALRELRVLTPLTDLVARLARRSGAYGAKITGAGGGGAVVALMDASLVDGYLDVIAGRGLRVFEPVLLAEAKA